MHLPLHGVARPAHHVSHSPFAVAGGGFVVAGGGSVVVAGGGFVVAGGSESMLPIVFVLIGFGTLSTINAYSLHECRLVTTHAATSDYVPVHRPVTIRQSLRGYA